MELRIKNLELKITINSLLITYQELAQVPHKPYFSTH